MKLWLRTLLLLLAVAFAASGLTACSCGNDDDDDDGTPADDDTSDDDEADDDTADDDTADDDTADDDTVDDDMADDDTTDDDTVDDDTADDDIVDDDTADDDSVEEVFVAITAGSFTMGSPEGEIGRRTDEAAHDVTLTHDFEIMNTETTQGKFAEVMGFNPAYFPRGNGSNDRLPVESATWYDALAFANRLSENNGYDVCYALTNIVCADDTTGDATTYCANNGGIKTAEVTVNAASVYECEGYRLPTEAEWEYAARAGSTSAFYNGGITVPQCTPADPNLNEIAWFCGNADRMNSAEIGGKQPNDWGLYDMSGNVAEWVWDWYGATYGGDVTDPTGPADGSVRVIRGGAFRYDGALRCRSAARTGQRPEYRSWYVGIRLVRTLPDRDGAANDFRYDPPPAPAAKHKAYPTELPFTFTRPDVGTPLTQNEIDEFTAKITGFFKDSGYFHWLLQVSHGMGEGNPDDMPPYKLFYGDMSAYKEDGVVTFTHGGFDDNLTIPTSKLFNNVAALYLMSGDETVGRLVEQYCKGYVALFRGMMWDTDERDPEKTIIARAIFPRNNSYIEEGREAYVNYDPVRHEVYDWNAHTVPNPTNPYYGEETWVRNMRSKDDVPHIYRAVPLMQRLVEDAPDESVREAAAESLAYLQGFAKDVTDSGWYNRTKEFGNWMVPVDSNGYVVDLASYVNYTPILPTAECSGRETSALIGYADPLDTACTNGIGWLYEVIATFGNSYNYDIVRYFHIAEATTALMAWEIERAQELVEGLAVRTDYMLYIDPFRENYDWWDAESAGTLMAFATAGLPMTSEEARLVMTEYSKAADWYITWPNWDLWSASVPDGAVEWRPSDNSPAGPVVYLDDITFIFEYCYSPFRNPATAPLLNCDIVADPDLWGTVP